MSTTWCQVLALACYGDRLISGSDDRCIRVWRLGTWDCERILTGHNGGVVGVCIVDGMAQMPCVCAYVPCVPTRSILVRIENRDLLLQLRSSLLAFTCDLTGNLISASNDSFIKVWNSTGVQRPFTAK